MSHCRPKCNPCNDLCNNFRLRAALSSNNYYPSSGAFATATLTANSNILTVTDTSIYPLVNPHLTFTNPGPNPLTIVIPSLGIDTTLAPGQFITVPISVPGSYGSASFPYSINGSAIATLTASNLRNPVILPLNGTNSGVFISFYGLAGVPSYLIAVTNSGNNPSSILHLTFSTSASGTLTVDNPDGSVLIPTQTLNPGQPISLDTTLTVPPGDTIFLPYSFNAPVETILTLQISGSNFISVSGPLPISTELVPGTIATSISGGSNIVTLGNQGGVPLVNPTLQASTTDPNGGYGVTVIVNGVPQSYSVTATSPAMIPIGITSIPGGGTVSYPYYFTAPSSGALATNAVFTLNGSNIIAPVSTTVLFPLPAATTITGTYSSPSGPLVVTNTGEVTTDPLDLVLSNPGPQPLTFTFEGSTNTLNPGGSISFPNIGTLTPNGDLGDSISLPLQVTSPGVLQYQVSAANTNVVTGSIPNANTIIDATNQFVPAPVSTSLSGPNGTIVSSPTTNGFLVYTNLYPSIPTTGTITGINITGGSININGTTYSQNTSGLSIPVGSISQSPVLIPYTLTIVSGPVTVTVFTSYTNAPSTAVTFTYTQVAATVGPSSITVSTPYDVPLGAGFLNVNVIQGAMTIDGSLPIIKDISLRTPGITNVSPSNTTYTITNNGASILTYNYNNASPLVVNFPNDIILPVYFTASVQAISPTSGNINYNNISPLYTQPGFLSVNVQSGSITIAGNTYPTGTQINLSLPAFVGPYSLGYAISPGSVVILTTAISNVMGSPIVYTINGSSTVITAVNNQDPVLGDNINYINQNTTVSIPPLNGTLMVTSGNIIFNGQTYDAGTYPVIIPSSLVVPYTISDIGIANITTAPSSVVNGTSLTLYGQDVLLVNNPVDQIILINQTPTPVGGFIILEVQMGQTGGSFTINNTNIVYDYTYVFPIATFTGQTTIPYSTTGQVTVLYAIVFGDSVINGTLNIPSLA